MSSLIPRALVLASKDSTSSYQEGAEDEAGGGDLTAGLTVAAMLSCVVEDIGRVCTLNRSSEEAYARQKIFPPLWHFQLASFNLF
jgi:hypothetical protein